MIEYYGTIEVLTDTHSMISTPLDFRFSHKNTLTREKVKLEAINSLHDQTTIFGVSSITYKWKIV